MSMGKQTRITPYDVRVTLGVPTPTSRAQTQVPSLVSSSSVSGVLLDPALFNPCMRD